MKYTIIITILSVATAVGITLFITTAINDRNIKKAIEISKKAAVAESKFQDSLRFERGVKLSLEKMYKLRGDTLLQIKKRKNEIQTVIRYITVLPLSADSLERILTKRQYHSSAR